MPLPSFDHRTQADEMMDDFTIVDERLERALENLGHVNRWLGGYGATMAALGPFLRAREGAATSVLDVGTGGGDFPAYLARWAARHRADVAVVGLDANPATVDWARRWLDRSLAQTLRGHVEVVTGDALDLPYADDAFDVVTASLFLHHFAGEEAVRLLEEMQRVARYGVVINDLHRHPLAFASIKLLSAVLPVSPMFAHDGPISVLRGFRRVELAALCEAAGLAGVRITWRWAFRWMATTLEAGR